MRRFYFLALASWGALIDEAMRKRGLTNRAAYIRQAVHAALVADLGREL